MSLSFSKYQGAGNDFVLLDNRTENILLTQAQIEQICNRRFGVGADGLMLLQNKAGYDFEMVYFNSDGNRSSMCGNGGRCIAAYAQSLGVVNKEGKFIAVDGDHRFVFLNDGNVCLSMNDVPTIESRAEQVYILNTGSPHYVQVVENVDVLNVKEKGSAIRYNDEFKNQGINVNFMEYTTDGIIVRTYERGVEDETLSCGTGVTASAIVSVQDAIGKFEVPVQTLGGKLKVVFEKHTTDGATNIQLIGAAVKVFEGAITI